MTWLIKLFYNNGDFSHEKKFRSKYQVKNYLTWAESAGIKEEGYLEVYNKEELQTTIGGNNELGIKEL